MPTCLAKLLAIPILVGCMLNLYVTGWSTAEGPGAGPGLFDRGNLVAWCIVPFDGKRRGPEERAAMLERLGVRHFAYDWRGRDSPPVAAPKGGPEGAREGGAGLFVPAAAQRD